MGASDRNVRAKAAVCVCVFFYLYSHREVGAKATVDAEAAVAQEDAKCCGCEAWVALRAVRACLVGWLTHQRVQSLHCDTTRWNNPCGRASSVAGRAHAGLCCLLGLVR